MKKIFLYASVLAIVLFSFGLFFGVASADYTIEETTSGALPFSTWADSYETDCDNEFWVGQGQVCDAYGYTPDHNFSLSAVRLYNVQCDSAERTTKTFKAQIRLNSTGAVVAETETATINCVSTPPSGSANTPEYDLAIVGGPYSLSTATTYAFSIAVTANYTDNLWVRTANSSVMGASLMSGTADASITWNTPADNYTGPDFTYWTYTLSNLEASSTYHVDIQYETPDGQPYYFLYQDSFYNTNSSVIYASPKQNGLWIPGYASTTPWTVNAYLKNQNNTTIDSVGPLSLWINSQATTTYANYNSYNTSSTISTWGQQISSSTATCGVAYTCSNASSTSWFTVDWACTAVYAAQQIGNAMFCPPTIATNIVNDAVGNLKTVDPFRTVFTIVDTVSSSVASATSSDVAITLNLGGTETEFTLLNGTSPIGSEAAKDALFLFWRSLLYVGGAFGAIGMITKSDNTE